MCYLFKGTVQSNVSTFIQTISLSKLISTTENILLALMTKRVVPGQDITKLFFVFVPVNTVREAAYTHFSYCMGTDSIQLW